MVTPENANAGGGDGDDLTPTSSMLAKLLLKRNNPVFGNMFAAAGGASVRVGVLLIYAMQQIVKFLVGNEEKFCTVASGTGAGSRESGNEVQLVRCTFRRRSRGQTECFLTNNIEAGVINLTKGGVALLEVCRTHAGYKYALCRVALVVGRFVFQASICMQIVRGDDRLQQVIMHRRDGLAGGHGQRRGGRVHTLATAGAYDDVFVISDAGFASSLPRGIGSSTSVCTIVGQREGVFSFSCRITTNGCCRLGQHGNVPHQQGTERVASLVLCCVFGRAEGHIM
eukprot:gene14461-15963_t